MSIAGAETTLLIMDDMVIGFRFSWYMSVIIYYIRSVVNNNSGQWDPWFSFLVMSDEWWVIMSPTILILVLTYDVLFNSRRTRNIDLLLLRFSYSYLSWKYIVCNYQRLKLRCGHTPFHGWDTPAAVYACAFCWLHSCDIQGAVCVNGNRGLFAWALSSRLWHSTHVALSYGILVHRVVKGMNVTDMALLFGKVGSIINQTSVYIELYC